jgi:hypothetical protein
MDQWLGRCSPKMAYTFSSFAKRLETMDQAEVVSSNLAVHITFWCFDPLVLSFLHCFRREVSLFVVFCSFDRLEHWLNDLWVYFAFQCVRSLTQPHDERLILSGWLSRELA